MKIKQLTAVMLSVLLLMGIFPLSVSAAERTRSGMIDELEDSNNSGFIAEHEEVLEYMYGELMNHSEQIMLKSYKIPSSDLNQLFLAVIGVYPEIFFVGRGYSYSTNGNYVNFIKPNYLNTADEVSSMLEQFYDKADWYLSFLDDSMDDFTKALVLHDQLAINNFYQITSEDGTDSTNYTFMVEGWGRCENYAEVYAYLLAQEGIKSEIINSASMSHEWMKIKLDGSDYYYNIDLTWDDPLYANIGDRPGKANHTYFLLSDEEFQKADSAAQRNAHYDYSYIHGSDTAYDDYDNLHGLDNPMYYLGGDLYTLYTSGSKGYIATYNHYTDEFTNKITIDDVWHAGAYGWWNGNYSGIGEYEGLLYFNGENCVYVYNPLTGEKTIYIDNALSDGNQLYGMYVRDGKIIGLEASGPSSATTEVTLGDCIVKYYAVETADGITHGTVTADVQEAKAGDTVTLTVTPDAGFIARAVSYNDIELTPDNGIYSFTMPAGDVKIHAQFEAYPFAGHSISLEGNIGVNFYFNLTEEQAENASVSFAWADRTIESAPLVAKVRNGRVYYRATCEVAAKEMTDDITATVVIDNESYTGDTFSVVDYALTVIQDDAGAYTQPLKDLVKSMLIYGAKSQLQFNYHTDKLADDHLSEYTLGTVDISELTVPDYSEVDFTQYGLRLAGTSLSLKSTTSYNLYFMPINGQAPAEVKLGDEVIAPTENNGFLCYEISDIPAEKITDDYILTFNGNAVTFNSSTYIHAAVSGDEPLATTVTALFAYNQTAKNYFN